MTRKPSAEGSPHLAWFKSSYSSNSNEPDCVEVALAPAAVHIRDTKSPGGPVLAVTPATWTTFLSHTSAR